MKKVVITYGLIAGVLIIVFMWTMTYLWDASNLVHSEIYGYASMLVSLSMVFFGIKSYRDNQKGRSVGFWKGAQIGVLISLIASVIYGLSWEAYLQTKPDFMDRFIESYITKLKEKGAPQEEIDRAEKEMASLGEMYKNPVKRFGLTVMEILPVGLIVTLISAGLLRRKEVLAE